jgi:ABC-type transporter Mla subunit MlaD
MDLYISIKDLGLLILFLAGIFALVFLCITLYKLFKLIGKLTDIVDTNRANFDKTMDQIPGTVTNINSVLEEVKGTAESANALVDGISNTALETAATLEKTYGEYIDLIKNAIAIFLKVKELFK